MTATKAGRAWDLPDFDQAYREFFGVESTGDKPTAGLDADAPGDDPEAGYNGQTFQECSAVEKFWRAKIAELDFRKRSGGLIEKSLAIELYVREVASCRTKLLALPARLKQRASLSDEQVALADSLIREALEALTDGSAIDAGADGADD